MQGFKLNIKVGRVVAIFVDSTPNALDPNAAGGYVLVDRGPDEYDRYVTWRFDQREVYGEQEQVLSLFWGHYTNDRDAALTNLFERAGFGRVEALQA
jgi:hypothetical protein